MAAIEVSQYLYNHLKEQLKALYDKRESLKNDFSEALELGDEVENAPLDAATHAIDINEPRIWELEFLIKNLKVSVSAECGVIMVGSVFVARNKDTGEVSNFILCTPEISAYVPTEWRFLSISTPLGAAAQGKKVGETFESLTPAGRKVYIIIKILH